MATVYEATASAPVNIAVIKYWGKRDTKLILPTNSSLSVTLDQDHLRSTTTSRADPSFTEDRLWLNGKVDEITPGSRLATCIAEMKRLRKETVEDKDPNAPKLSTYKVHIASYNNFPTAAGLASSASGFAALVASLAQLYALPASPSTLSLIARQGSGSACRSLFGGFVAWEMGALPSGEDSLAVEIAPREHWPQMHALICVVSDDKKGTSSTSGMQRTVDTSPLLQHRIAHVVPQRMAAISDAIRARDFDTFARITMADSNQFHAVALDTEPPIFYMNDVSRAIIALIVEYNRLALAQGKGYKAAYTYDAGPNAVIYALEENIKEIAQLVTAYFPQRAGEFKDVLGLYGDAAKDINSEAKVPEGFNEAVAKRFEVGAVKGLIHTRVGDGPRRLPASESLLAPSGLPKTLA
ncbi:Diphosphomevalonate decarboxylase [Psilocybe cubensis]|uniref:Diphosphomevalonate decarboxylase n=2 Tax=Psilocybe cubensis TaxID=181762 RepID=A0ACB8HA56_PSICU|nr:Diphosphomevalonate decarboxylase [Psilocybe cubensis]KAH9484893.1 Diphosphomevalonate decarboxylase [Psilocybe cubensis]